VHQRSEPRTQTQTQDAVVVFPVFSAGFSRVLLISAILSFLASISIFGFSFFFFFVFFVFFFRFFFCCHRRSFSAY
jgi:hypothetical protein